MAWVPSALVSGTIPPLSPKFLKNSGIVYIHLVHTALWVYIHIMTKKPMTFRLSEAARKRLAELASGQGLSATAVVEGLILGFSVSGSVGIRDDLTEVSPAAGSSFEMPSGPSESVVGGVKRVQRVPQPGWKQK